MTTPHYTVRLWKENGIWHAAVPRHNPLRELMGDDPHWWKKHGLIGSGATPEEAQRDLRSWQRCAKIVSDIY